jgi:TolA-binding protein
VLLILILAMFGAMIGHAADADVEKIKAELQKQIDAQVNALRTQYEKRIESLEKRIQTLEGDNQRLKGTATATNAATPEDIARMKQRITELEAGAGKASPEALEAAQRSAANAEAIEGIQRKLHADATETRDIYRMKEAGPSI